MQRDGDLKYAQVADPFNVGEASVFAPSEQQRADVREKRGNVLREAAQIDPNDLVFLDKSGPGYPDDGKLRARTSRASVSPENRRLPSDTLGAMNVSRFVDFIRLISELGAKTTTAMQGSKQ